MACSACSACPEVASVDGGAVLPRRPSSSNSGELVPDLLLPRKIEKGNERLRKRDGKKIGQESAVGTHRGGQNRRNTVAAERTPATKSGGLGAYRRGLLGSNGRGRRGLFIGRNRAQLG